MIGKTPQPNANALKYSQIVLEMRSIVNISLLQTGSVIKTPVTKSKLTCNNTIVMYTSIQYTVPIDNVHQKIQY